MTQPLQPVGPEAGVAGVTGAEFLPFTGSVLTLPIAILGMALTFVGWILMRFGAEES